MPGRCEETRWARRPQQAPRSPGRAVCRIGQAAGVLLLAGCAGGNPLDTPVAWWHDLQGGAIASQRPPPPGVGMPYPKLVTVPSRPALPDPGFRQSLQEQLLAERDRTERIAAHTPFEPPVLGPPSPSAPASARTPDVASAAQASLPAAEAAPAPPGAATAAAGPPPDAPVVLVGTVAQEAFVPSLPAAPPPPASFEGVPAEPLPAPPPPTPPHLPAALRGTDILFLPGEAVLRQSQMETLRHIAFSRKQQRLEITGLGEAASDSPDGQAAAIDLGLKRAYAVAEAFASLHVPARDIVLAAYAFGRGAEVRLVPQ